MPPPQSSSLALGTFVQNLVIIKKPHFAGFMYFTEPRRRGGGGARAVCPRRAALRVRGAADVSKTDSVMDWEMGYIQQMARGLKGHLN